MAEDFWGNAITASEPATIQAIADFSEGLIKFDKKAAKVIRAAKQDPSSALANAYAAMLLMWMETANGPEMAAPFWSIDTACMARPRWVLRIKR